MTTFCVVRIFAFVYCVVRNMTALLSGAGQALTYRDFWALKDISFELKRGESVGIIGRNGSGKSTLLQIIAGTLQPTSGTVKVKGKVAALLELGSGFNTEFTGRENIYIYTSVLGFNRAEADRKYSSIVDFSEIGEFIEQPVKTYSSGMIMRLAFACIVHVEPDILIVDEALSVGDIRFQRKCKEWIDGLIKKGVTFLFVSHSPAEVAQITQRGLLLDRGQLLRSGPSKEVIVDYQRLLFGEEVAPTPAVPALSIDLARAEELADKARSPVIGMPAPDRDQLVAQARKFLNNPAEPVSSQEIRHGNRTTEIIDFGIYNSSGQRSSVVTGGQPCLLFFYGVALKPFSRLFIAFVIRNVNGVELFYTNSELQSMRTPQLECGAIFQVNSQVIVRLNPGDYFLSVVTRDGESHEATDRRLDAYHFSVMDAESKCGGLVNLDPTLDFKIIGNSSNGIPSRNP